MRRHARQEVCIGNCLDGRVRCGVTVGVGAQHAPPLRPLLPPRRAHENPVHGEPRMQLVLIQQRLQTAVVPARIVVVLPVGTGNVSDFVPAEATLGSGMLHPKPAVHP